MMVQTGNEQEGFHSPVYSQFRAGSEGDDPQKRLSVAFTLQQIKRTTYETKDTQLIHTKYLDEQAVESYKKALEAEKMESENKK